MRSLMIVFMLVSAPYCFADQAANDMPRAAISSASSYASVKNIYAKVASNAQTWKKGVEQQQYQRNKKKDPYEAFGGETVVAKILQD